MEKLIINDFCCLRYGIGKGITYSTPLNEINLLKGKCSVPILSPYKDRLFYFYPYGDNERFTKLYYFDMETKKKVEIAKSDGYNSSPKKALWLNNDEILVIIGLNSEALRSGGDVYKYSIDSESLSPYYICEKMQIVQDIVIADDEVYLRGIIFDDDFKTESSRSFTYLV
ncbi:MAG: DUF4652 domain-containing protein [Oscillospiraceae bacterium]|nr:DUF4652 domain-containing protein [Oscillospiraceae bacterium]